MKWRKVSNWRSYHELLRIVVVTMVVGCSGAPTSDAASTSKDLALDSAMAALEKRGAKAVLDSMFYNPNVDSVYSSHIQTGDSMWLEFARRLKPSSDAGSSEWLEIDLALALPNAPTRVLRILADSSAQFDIGWVCNLPLIEAPDSAVQNLRSRSLAGLATVKEPQLKKIRDECERLINR